MLGIFVALLLGVLSLYPWLGILFLIFSAPMFIRWSNRAEELARRESHPNVKRISLALSTMGTIGLVFSIVLAGAGTFFGTCHATVAITVIMTIVKRNPIDNGWVTVTAGIVIGTLVSGWAVWQMLKLVRDPAKEKEPSDN